MDIRYREVRESDIPVLADLIWRTWASPGLKQTPAVAVHYGYMLLYTVLSCSQVVIVAEVDGTACGLIAIDLKTDGLGEKRVLVQETCDARRMLHEVGLVLDREGNQCRNAWHALWQAFRNAKAELDKSSSEDHGAEITLFAVDEVYRGQGIGTGLFNKAMSALQMSGIERFYLHSDAFSSHGFYEKRGMELVDRRPSIVSIGDKANVEIFIYMDSVERQL